MKLKALLVYTLTFTLLGLSSTVRADFFSSPFDWMDDDDDYYRYDRSGRDNGRDRWRRYDEWEPNYWRYRYFDDDSDDYFFDEFDGDYFGDGRGNFDFDMNMDFDADSRFDGDYDNDYRYRGDPRRYSPGVRDGYSRDGYSRDGYSRDGYSRDYDRPTPRSGSGYGDRRRQNNDDRYNDDYWRDYSQRYDGGSRRQPAPSSRDRRQ